MYSSVNTQKMNAYYEEAKEVAVMIFEEYIKVDAKYSVKLDKQTVRLELYKKFGYVNPNRHSDITEEDERINNSTLMHMADRDSGINHEIVTSNLSATMFNEIYEIALESLNAAFD